MIYLNYLGLAKVYNVVIGLGLVVGVLAMHCVMARNRFRLGVPKLLSRMQVSGVLCIRLDGNNTAFLFSANMTCIYQIFLYTPHF